MNTNIKAAQPNTTLRICLSIMADHSSGVFSGVSRMTLASYWCANSFNGCPAAADSATNKVIIPVKDSRPLCLCSCRSIVCNKFITYAIIAIHNMAIWAKIAPSIIMANAINVVNAFWNFTDHIYKSHSVSKLRPIVNRKNYIANAVYIASNIPGYFMAFGRIFNPFEYSAFWAIVDNFFKPARGRAIIKSIHVMTPYQSDVSGGQELQLLSTAYSNMGDLK